MELANGRVVLHAGDCLEVLASLPENSIDAVVTDPPYELGFMGKSWDASGIAFCPDTWRLLWRVLKPGGHLVAFGAPKNYHRLACAIEDADFEIRDSLMWVFGTGFPKSMDVSKAIDKAAGAERDVLGVSGKSGAARSCMAGDFAGGEYYETAPATDEAKQWDGWGTALKPAYEPIVLARKPLSEKTVAANVLRWGTGALNIDATRIAHNEPIKTMKAQDAGNLVYGQAGRRAETTELKEAGRWPANLCHDGSQQVLDLFPQSTGNKGIHGTMGGGRSGGIKGAAKQREYDFAGYGDEGSAARFFFSAKLNDEERGAVFGSEYENAANELEKIAREWDEQDKERLAYARWFASKLRAKAQPIENDETPRFHYSAKASKADRAGSKHPTVKPVSLMQWLVRMVTPPNGKVLDPFAGSGTTGMAAVNEGFEAVLIERELEYQSDIRNRLHG